ncbi:MAG: hypothetical protein QOI31_2614 [Solirubrobacterales bacterium]|jgi:hypothetical protein|nr:hypothetical protein [Solirubrobacterales bacterium]
MKLELPTRKPKAEKGAKQPSKVQAPAFAQDLYKDMRDRRLIIPAVALLIAIVAVPMLLSSSPESAVSVPPPVSDPQAVAVEPAVLAVQEVGVRDFRDRLDELQRKNPFGDRFEPKAVKDSVGALEDPTADSGGGSPVDTGTSPVDSSPTPSSSSDPPAPIQPQEPFVLVPRIDVEVGNVDRNRRKTIDGVKSGEVLPWKSAPAAMFLGNSDDSGSAEFLVSRDVTTVNGDGHCRPGKNNCEFLTLRDGDSGYLRFADGNRYVITVKDIYFVRVSEDQFKDQD